MDTYGTTVKMDKVGSPEMLLPIYKSILHHISEDCDLQITACWQEPCVCARHILTTFFCNRKTLAIHRISPEYNSIFHYWKDTSKVDTVMLSVFILPKWYIYLILQQELLIFGIIC
jgi:hypothetical protein